MRHIWNAVSSPELIRREMNVVGQIQQKAVKMDKELEHPSL